MDIDERIRRRRRREKPPRLVRDYGALSPVAHAAEPTGRGPTLERLLDHLDPVFDGELPANAYLHGPAGSGKSAVVAALFDRLRAFSTERNSAIHTSTRAASPDSPAFVYLDLRETTSEFAVYHAVLDALVEETVPEHGVSTGALRRRLRDRLESSAGCVVAADHVGESEGTSAAELVELFAGLPSNVSWLAVGRDAPDETPLTRYTAATFALDRYRRQALVDVLVARSSDGLARQALDHDLTRTVAEWAAGNAHDALAALFVAADHADRADGARLTEADIDAGIADVPVPCVSLGRVLSLPANKQLVLRRLVDLGDEERASVEATTDAIGAHPAVELSSGTVKRYLYEMAEIGVVERVSTEAGSKKGRPPSRVELRFPPTVFRRLYDAAR